jgi:hypothetical protein
MMQFAARGALQVSAAENIEILVHLARHNKIFGDLARMTLAGWDEKACVAAASNPETPREVLNYFISPDNLRPVLLPALLENPSVLGSELAKLAIGASRETIDAMLKSARVRTLDGVLEALKANPYLTREEGEELRKVSSAGEIPVVAESTAAGAGQIGQDNGSEATDHEAVDHKRDDHEVDEAADDGTVSAYLKEHEQDIAAEGDKPFQAIGGIVDLLGPGYFPVTQEAEAPAPAAAATAAAKAGPAAKKPEPPGTPRRENALQKINRLGIKDRIQLALKGNKEERSLLIRDGTKVVALAVLEAPKLSDGEVEKFASQKNVLEAVLRQIPLKRRFMKNYIVVRNLVANPRTPLDLGLGLMKNLLITDLKNLSGNKEVSETIRKLAMKMYKQKLDQAAKK